MSANESGRSFRFRDTAEPLDFLTKDQLLKVFERWGVTEPVPRTGKKVVVSFPRPTVPNIATIKRSEHRSTYGKTLYSVEYERA